MLSAKRRRSPSGGRGGSDPPEKQPNKLGILGHQVDATFMVLSRSEGLSL